MPRKHPRHVDKYTMTPDADNAVRDRVTFDLGSSPSVTTESPTGLLRKDELATGAVTVTVVSTEPSTLTGPTGPDGLTLTGVVFAATERVMNREVLAGEGVGLSITLIAAQQEGEYLIRLRVSTNNTRELDWAFTLVIDSYEA